MWIMCKVCQYSITLKQMDTNMKINIIISRKKILNGTNKNKTFLLISNLRACTSWEGRTKCGKIMHWMLGNHQKDSTRIQEKQVHNIAWGLLNSTNNTCIKLPFFETLAMKCKAFMHIKNSDKTIIKSLNCNKNIKTKNRITKNDQISEWEGDKYF